MKKAVLRDNVRKTKVTSQGAKNPQSQSPPHKKLLKKIEGIQTNATNGKYDLSLQDKLLKEDHQEETHDFRVEIERRFKKSLPNREFRFPLHPIHSSDSESQTSSKEASLDSLRHVTVYDLTSQNKSKKTARNVQKVNNYTTERTNTNYEYDEQTQASSYSYVLDFEDEEDLEIRIRDKSSSAYKKLIKLLESNSMFSHNSTNPKPDNPQKTQAQNNPQKTQTKYQNLQVHDSSAGNNHNFLIPVVKDQETQEKNYYTSGIQRTDYGVGDSMNYNPSSQSTKAKPRNASAHANVRSSQNRPESSKDVQKNTTLYDYSSTGRSETHQLSHSQERTSGGVGSQQSSRPESNLKKAMSYDKSSHNLRGDSVLIATNQNNNNSSRVKNTFIDTSKMSQESLKKIYSNNILKSITPQYNNVKQQTNQLFSRDGIFKTYNNEGFRAEAASGAGANLVESNSSASLTGVKSPLSSLYQRAQKDVLTHKIAQFQVGNEQNRELTPSGSSQRKHKMNSKPQSNSNVTSMLTGTKRDETPKSISSKIALGSQNSNIYASPDQYAAMNLSISQNKLSKKNSVKALHGLSPNKKTTASEKAIYMSYDFNQANALKKQVFKLDLNNRNQLHSRDTLSSGRMRNKTAERSADETEKHTLSRTIIEQNPSISVLNGSTCKSSHQKSFGQLIPTNKLR